MLNPSIKQIDLFRNSGFVDFLDYFGRFFDFLYRGSIRKLIQPACKTGSRNALSVVKIVSHGIIPRNWVFFMKLVNKTRYAILGMLLNGPSTGYEIKSLMNRSTVYFWRESDSTIYPMFKVLAKEGKVLSKIVHVGKKKKEVFSIAETGRAEFKAWLKRATGSETPRNEFLLKLFFVTDREEMIRLFQERLEGTKKIYEE